MPSVQIYNNANNSTRVLNFEFVGDVLAAYDSTFTPSTASSSEYYFKITTGSVQEDETAYTTKVVRDLSELALKKVKQSHYNYANAYADIKSMIIDYTYDYIHGHTANQFSSGCTEQKPMKFN